MSMQTLFQETLLLMKKKQEQIKNSNHHKSLENLGPNNSFEPPIKRLRGRPRKNVLTVFKTTPSQTKRKRERPGKQIIEEELPEYYTKNPSQIELGFNSDSDLEYLDYLKEIQAKNKRKKNSKKHKKFIIPQEGERENYSSTFNDKVIDIVPKDEENSENSCIEQIFKNQNIEDTFNEHDSEINKKLQIKTRENVKNYNNSESEEIRPPPEPPSSNSKSTRKILMNKNIVECHDQLTMRKDNYVYFVTTNGTPRDNESISLKKLGTLPKFRNLQKGCYALK